MIRNLPSIWETQVQSLGLGRSPGVGTGYPLQYSCLENSMDRAAWQATVMGSQSQTLSNYHLGFSNGSAGRESTYNAGDTGDAGSTPE